MASNTDWDIRAEAEKVRDLYFMVGGSLTDTLIQFGLDCYAKGVADATATAEVDNDDTTGVVKSPGQTMKNAGY